MKINQKLLYIIYKIIKMKYKKNNNLIQILQFNNIKKKLKMMIKQIKNYKT